jgi:hypothetical protein
MIRIASWSLGLLTLAPIKDSSILRTHGRLRNKNETAKGRNGDTATSSIRRFPDSPTPGLTALTADSLSLLILQRGWL